MKIGIFTDSYFPQVSGVSTSIRTLKEDLESQGHEVIIFTTTDPRADNDEKNIIRLTSIPFLSFKDRRIAVKGMNKALKEAKKQNIDIVHTHTEFSLGLTGKFVGYMLGIPTVHTYHTMYEKYLHYIANGKVVKPKAVKIASRYFCNRTMGIIAPSQQMKDKLSSYNIYKEIRVIPTGVQIPERIAGIRQSKREELGIADSELVLLSLCRLSSEKNLDKLIHAFPEVLEQYPSARLVFVGDGPSRKGLEELVSELDVSEKVLFVGEVKNEEVNAYYQMADIYINASDSETQGLTYLESIVNGCPVIAKRNDYLSGLITQAGLGRLFDKDEEIGQTITAYANLYKTSDVVTQQEVWDDLMNEISSETFGNRVLSYYRQIIENYYLQPREEVKLRVNLLEKIKR
ncbi:glycosyl transferases group 1 [Trichococcus palustris]|uniref:Glycosyl transferases group 1 n=1 Tax=Trichococcus palustris TaxID=140314 RepID=A0A143YQH9_9LACT|nr:glycosyltransferase family 4 protein [Trichococcus palustris]CZQ94556.1 glycosyl transferases group 1 [Trichococcus palustris]SFK91459.1 1,2-diacylglycerol 3-glucosyltransferase [Trichococcus palustris]